MALTPFHPEGEMPIDQWISRAREVAALRGWEADTLFRRAKLQLQGDAKTVVLNNEGSIDDFEVLAEVLTTWFGTTASFRTHLKDLAHIRQGSSTGRE